MEDNTHMNIPEEILLFPLVLTMIVVFLRCTFALIKHHMFVPKCNLNSTITTEALEKILEGNTKVQHAD